MTESFASAADAITAAGGTRASLCLPFLAVLPVTGASVSTLAAPFNTETVCASDTLAARLDELQIDLGEGPCWDALANRQPVLAPDVRSGEQHDWPMFTGSIIDEKVGALYAFPLVVGSLGVGALDLYSTEADSLNATQVEGAMSLAAVAARQVLRRAMSSLAAETADLEREEGQYSRRVVHQATGMVLAQLDVSAEDALLIIRAHAYASGRSVRDVSNDIIERRLDLAADGPASWPGN
jgi:hypothetical protein